MSDNGHLHTNTHMQDAKKYLRIALQEARKSPPRSTNFRVGACLVSPSRESNPLLVTGYTLECEGNTHAEQSCFLKFAQQHGCAELEIGQFLPADCVMYTTMEPCVRRSVGNQSCVDRILQITKPDGSPAIVKIYVGVMEPETFVGVNEGKTKLQDVGIDVVQVVGLEDEILEVATAGHSKDGTDGKQA